MGRRIGKMRRFEAAEEIEQTHEANKPVAY